MTSNTVPIFISHRFLTPRPLDVLSMLLSALPLLSDSDCVVKGFDLIVVRQWFTTSNSVHRHDMHSAETLAVRLSIAPGPSDVFHKGPTCSVPSETDVVRRRSDASRFT